MQRTEAPEISIIMTHRGNPDVLREFYRQVFDTAVRPENIEIISCIDDDDTGCHGIEFQGLSIKQLLFPYGTKGSTYIHTAYRASQGRLIMLMATDMIIHTPGWDVAILDEFAKWPDGIGLVYPNDLIFKGALAQGGMTVSRKACELLGYLTYPIYRWFRSEDHIHHIYDILRQLGHDRIVYLPDVIIEHLSYVERDGQRLYDKAPIFVGDVQSDDGGRYQDLHTSRILDALKLAMFIDPLKFNEYIEAAKNVQGPFFHYLNVQELKKAGNGDAVCIDVNGKLFPIESYKGYNISPCLDDIRKQ